jgi:hypothetical protein
VDPGGDGRMDGIAVRIREVSVESRSVPSTSIPISRIMSDKTIVSFSLPRRWTSLAEPLE